MIWALTKRNHDLSCNRLIRWWLRVGLMSRLVISLFLLVLAGLIFVIFDIILSIFVRGGFAATGLVILILILLFAFIVTDTLLDYVGTKQI